MAATLEDRKLWMALSEVFVDVSIDNRDIARVIKDYPMRQIEFAFFERVAPICISNLIPPAPSVIWGFDEDSLVEEIEHMVVRRSRQWILRRIVSRAKMGLMRLICSGMWKGLKAEVEKEQRR